MHEALEAPPGAPRPARLPGGPVPLTLRQSAIAAVLVLAVGLGIALLTPVAAAVSARRVTPPGAIRIGQAAVVPAAGWAVEDRDTTGVLLTRAGARMVVHWWVTGYSAARPGVVQMSTVVGAENLPSASRAQTASREKGGAGGLTRSSTVEPQTKWKLPVSPALHDGTVEYTGRLGDGLQVQA